MRRSVHWACAVMLLQGCAGLPGMQAKKPPTAVKQEDFSLAPYLKEVALQSSVNHDYAAAASFWGAVFESDPSNREAALKFASNLRYAGQPQGAISALNKALVTHPGDPQLLAERGKAYAGASDFAPALADIDEALKTSTKDWTLYSARGVTLDRLARPADAEAAYKQALALSPGNPKVLNNMALNIALSGRLDEAIALLRTAALHPQATVQVRQNLSLLLAMKGNVDEAGRLARADLSAAMSENNIAFFRSLKAAAAP